MAEKYGEVPKKFTKEWWPYFWMYYKGHTLAILFAVFFISHTLYECSTIPKYDLTATYTGKTVISQQDEEKITEFLKANTNDIDKNEEVNPYFQQLVIDPSSLDADLNMAMQTRLTTEFQSERSFIFLLDENSRETLLKNERYTEAFLPVNEWLAEKVSEERLVYIDGTAYAVSLSGSEFTKDFSSPEGELYVALCTLRYDDEENKEAFENSKAILNAIVK